MSPKGMPSNHALSIVHLHHPHGLSTLFIFLIRENALLGDGEIDAGVEAMGCGGRWCRGVAKLYAVEYVGEKEDEGL